MSSFKYPFTLGKHKEFWKDLFYKICSEVKIILHLQNNGNPVDFYVKRIVDYAQKMKFHGNSYHFLKRNGNFWNFSLILLYENLG